MRFFSRRTRRYDDARLVKVVLRHAKSRSNAAAEQGDPLTDRVGGYQPRIDLDPEGERQAREIGGLILDGLHAILGQEYKIVRFSASPARRTRRTAEIARAAMGFTAVTLPLCIDRRIHEERKGYRILGGDERRLRADVMTPAYRARKEREGWDFRHGHPVANRVGLHILHRAETAREAGARMMRWFNEKLLVNMTDAAADYLLVDMAVAHGLATRHGLAQLLHSDPDNPGVIGISPDEAAAYQLENASATVLVRDVDGQWAERGRILLPEHQTPPSVSS